MNKDIKNEIDRILSSEDDRSWHQLFKFLHQHRENAALEEMVTYAERQLTLWHDKTRLQMAKRNFHFKTYDELSPVVSLIRHLVVSTKSEEWGSKYLNLIGQSPYVLQLKALTVKSCELYPGTLKRVFTSPFLIGLETLFIKNTLMEEEEINTLIESEFLGNLSKLSIIKQRVDTKWLIPFLKQLRGNKLTYLDLSYNQIGDSGAYAIANAAVWSRLEVLNLKRNAISKIGRETIMNSVFIPKETELIF